MKQNKMKNANSGYIGYSLSVRASEAYAGGFLPKTKLKAIYKISEKMFKEMASRDMFETEWHHTSKYFNKTTFYRVNEEGMIFLAIKGKLSEKLRKKVIYEHMLLRLNKENKRVKPIRFETANGCVWVVVENESDFKKAEFAAKCKYGESAKIGRSGNPKYYHVYLK